MGNHLGDHDHVLVCMGKGRISIALADRFPSVSYGTSFVNGTASFRLPWVSAREVETELVVALTDSY